MNKELDNIQSYIDHQFQVNGNDLITDSEHTFDLLQNLHSILILYSKSSNQQPLNDDLVRRICRHLLVLSGFKNHFTFCMNPIQVLSFVLLAELLAQVQSLDISIQQLDLCLKFHIDSFTPNSPPTYEHAKTILLQYLKRQQLDDLQDEKHGTINTLQKHTIGWRHGVGMVLYNFKTLFNRQDNPPCSWLQPSTFPFLLPPASLYFDCDLPILFSLYSYTHLHQGISSHLLIPIQQHYGLNTLPLFTKPSAWALLYHQLTDLMVLILLVAAIVEAAQMDFDSMSILLVVVVLNTLIGFTQEWKACKTLFAMIDRSQPMAQVIRDGHPTILPSHQLLPGDVVLLTDGDIVPADLRLVETHQLEIVESILSGESIAVQKQTDPILTKSRQIPLTECHGNAFMSTIVTHGHGKGVVVRTGAHTEIGKINTTLRNASSYKSKTRIQLKLDSLGKCLVGLSILLCFLVVMIGIIWKRDTEKMINVGLSLAVSVIPEGLVAVTTVTMALGIRRMMKKQCIMRTLPAVETLGSVTVICTDKTGTLTEGIMKTTELWTTDNNIYNFDQPLFPIHGCITHESDEAITAFSDTDDTLSSIGDPTPCNMGSTLLEYAMMICALCSNATLYYDPEIHELKSIGDPTELALLSAAQNLKLGPTYWKRRYLCCEKHLEHAFDSTRKLMTIVYAITSLQQPPALALPLNDPPLTTTTFTMVCKGAPEEILQRCTHYFSSNGEATIMDDTLVKTAMDRNLQFASQGQRVIGLAIKFIQQQSGKADDFIEQGLILVGLIALVDPSKQNVKEAIQVSQRAGIQIMMITGDQTATATAIATQLGIGSTVMVGKELDELSLGELSVLDPFPCVFARVSHDNKLKIIQALQQRGEVVAMVGDGINDSTAIKQADIGIAMGSGTEITKQAADMILLNNDFLTIISAIEEGRHVFDNILKFMVYLLSCNGAEIILMLICVIFNMEMPLTIMMILWANIIADIPPAMALGVEPKEKGLMDRAPRQPNLNVLTWASWITIGCQAFSIACLTLTVYLLSIHVLHNPLAQSQSVAFTTLTTLQLLHSFLSKSITQSICRHGLFANQWLVLAFGISFSLLILGIYTPGISSWLQLTFVDALSWVMILVCCLAQTLLVESGKWYLRSYRCVI